MISNTVFWVALAGLSILYIGFRMIIGHRRFKEYLLVMKEEGLLRSQHWVLIRVNFPMVKRITFTHVYLSRRRVMLFYALTRGKRVQAPLGPKGSAGREEGRFEVETRGGRSLLAWKTGLWGGGRIRMHVGNPKEWLADIKAQGEAKG